MWYLCFYVLEAVVIVAGNVTVLVVFTRTPTLRRCKHYLLVCLAVADLLVGVISVPMYITLLILARYKTSVSVLYRIQDVLFGTASLFGLTAVAIERAYAVYFPFKHRVLWKGVYMIGIAVIWVMAGLLAFSVNYFDELHIQISVMAAPMIFSLVVIMISYLLIWIKMNCMANVQGHANHERDNRLTVTLLMVTIISLIAWIPFQALMIYGMFCRNWCLIGKESLLCTAKFLHYGNSLINPIIYALRMPQFKRAVFDSVRCCKQDQRAVQVPNDRHQHYRASVIPLTNNNAFGTDGCQDHAVRDETLLKDKIRITQIYGRDGIQIKEADKEDTSL